MHKKSLIFFGVLAVLALAVGYLVLRGFNPASSKNNRKVQMVVSSDIALAEDETELAQSATVVALVIPTGSLQAYSTSSDGKVTHYKQSFAVIQYLKGNGTPGTILKVGRSAFTNQAQGVASDDDDSLLMGPLAPGQYILYLKPSGVSDTFGVVGVSQGALVVDVTGHVSAVSPTGFTSFIGMDVNAVKNSVRSAGN